MEVPRPQKREAWTSSTDKGSRRSSWHDRNYFTPPEISSPVETCDLHNTSKMSMITATTWVPRGFAAPFPEKYVFDEDEYERIAHLAKLQLEDAKEELEEAQNEKKEGSNGTSGNVSKSKDNEYAVHSLSLYYHTNCLLEKSTTT
jgi:hypothetical protein